MTAFIEFLGWMAGILGLITFMPQAIKTIRTRCTKNFSLLTFIVYSIANSCFLSLAFLSVATPELHPADQDSTQILLWALKIIVPTIVVMTLSFIIMGIKIYNIVTKKEIEPNTITEENIIVETGAETNV